jgi:hypothetical protein
LILILFTASSAQYLLHLKTKTTLTLLLFLIAAAFLYFNFYKKTFDTSLANLVPQGSAVLITIPNPQESFNSLTERNWWNAVVNIPFINKSDEQLKSIQSLLDNNQLQTKLNQLQHAVSLHITANDQIETLHFIKSDGFKWSEKAVNQIIDLLSPDNQAKVDQRTYEEMSINEFQFEGQDFAFLIIEDFLVYSTNAILIEDVIRTASGSVNSLFESYNVAIANSGELGITVNTSKLNDLGEVFFTNGELSDFKIVDGLLQLKMSSTENEINFRGLINSDKNSPTYDSFYDVAINERHYLPNALSMVSVMGIPKEVNPELEFGNLNLDEFKNNHNGSLTILEMDGGALAKERATLAMIKNPNSLQQWLDELALSLVKKETDTLYKEIYMDASITFLNKEGVINDFYGPSVPSFNQSYYSVYDDVLIISESVDMIKLILREYEEENTWGKIVEKRQFLDQLISEASYTKLVNFQFSVDGLKAQLKPKWATFFNEQQELLNLIDLVATQLSKSGNGFYSSSQITLNPLMAEASAISTTTDISKEIKLMSNTFADTRITTKPFVVTNHNNQSQEIILQDAKNDIYLISKEGAVIWKKSVGNTINGNVSQVDFFNNRKFQYLFATDSALFLIDRNGNDVEGFPKPFTSELPLLNLSVVDYDNSKQYRYVGYDRRGNTYLFDKQGDLLEGWNPKKGGSALLETPWHIRVRGKDCFVFVRADGTVELTNRRGENYNGFPFNAGKRLSGDVKIIKGPSFSTTTINIITEDGLQLSVDLNGIVKTRNQLFKPTLQSTFTLVSDILETDFIVVRRDERKTVLFDSSGDEIFQLDFVLDENDWVDFYNFRNESEVFVINRSGELSILDKSGSPKISSSLYTAQRVGIVYYQSRGEYELFINFDNQFAIYTFTK